MTLNAYVKLSGLLQPPSQNQGLSGLKMKSSTWSSTWFAMEGLDPRPLTCLERVYLTRVF